MSEQRATDPVPFHPPNIGTSTITIEEAELRTAEAVKKAVKREAWRVPMRWMAGFALWICFAAAMRNWFIPGFKQWLGMPQQPPVPVQRAMNDPARNLNKEVLPPAVTGKHTARYWRIIYFDGTEPQASVSNNSAADANDSEVAVTTPLQHAAIFQDIVEAIKTTPTTYVDPELVALARKHSAEFVKAIALLKRQEEVLNLHKQAKAADPAADTTDIIAALGAGDAEMQLLIGQFMLDARQMQGRLSERYKGEDFPSQ